jgi:hypothetical protein
MIGESGAPRTVAFLAAVGFKAECNEDWAFGSAWAKNLFSPNKMRDQNQCKHYEKADGANTR